MRETTRLTKKTSETDLIFGCCMLIKSKVIKQIGFLDPRFFLCGLDTYEYSLRAKKKGFKLLYVPSAKIYHKLSRAAVKIRRTCMLKNELEGMIVCYSLCANKPYHVPSLIFLNLLSFLAKRFRELTSLFISKEKREKFRNFVKSGKF
jgi:GT2 family glycosyltransferase